MDPDTYALLESLRVSLEQASITLALLFNHGVPRPLTFDQHLLLTETRDRVEDATDRTRAITGLPAFTRDTPHLPRRYFPDGAQGTPPPRPPDEPHRREY